jgi:hypothetical protein
VRDFGCNESGQEVTTVEKSEWTRPSALRAVCAPVSALPSLATVAAHSPVGYDAVAPASAGGTMLAKQRRPQTQLKGTNGFAVKVSVIGTDPVGGVRGKPPRGWPV